MSTYNEQRDELERQAEKIDLICQEVDSRQACNERLLEKIAANRGSEANISNHSRKIHHDN